MDVKHLVMTACVPLDDGGQALPRWLRQARPLARQLAVTGGLIFDGERWIQLLEGPAAAIEVFTRLLQDPASGLGDPVVLHAGAATDAVRLCPAWLIGFVEPDDLVQLQARFATDAASALQALVRLLTPPDAG